MNYCINAAWHGGMDVTEAQVALTAAFCGSGFSHLPLDNLHRFSVGSRSGKLAV